MGFLPIYWKLLREVPATQLLSHRIAWSFILIVLIITAGRQWSDFRVGFTGRNFLIYFIAAILIGINWLTYVWAVNAGFIVETSLGYFINPLLSMLLGVIFLRERLRLVQWLPVALAAMGVIYLTIIYGRLPWIALLLAFSFGFYGFIKKLAPLGSFSGWPLRRAYYSCLQSFTWLPWKLQVKVHSSTMGHSLQVCLPGRVLLQPFRFSCLPRLHDASPDLDRCASIHSPDHPVSPGCFHL